MPRRARIRCRRWPVRRSKLVITIWRFGDYAKALADGGDPAAAIRELERALTLAPDLGEAHQLLGSLLFARGQHSAALVHLRRAVEGNPASAAPQGYSAAAP